jgi:hypothetical protein
VEQTLVFKPVVAMFVLTGLVWTYMYVRRLSFIFSNKVDPQSLATPELVAAVIPANISGPSNNLKNLFELPVVFYALCVMLFVTGGVDLIHLYCAWAFVLLRATHSLIHCFFNVVSLRFVAYLLSSLVLWGMVVRVALAVL